MPCMGPVPPSDKFVEEKLQEVLKLLGCYSQDPDTLIKPMREAREKVNAQLAEAIKEAIYQEDCETW